MAKNISLGMFFLQLALALFLLFSGLNATSAVVNIDSNGMKFSRSILSDSEVVKVVDQLVKNKDFASAIILVLALAQIACGAILILNFFIETKKVTEILLIIMLVLWGLIILFMDVLGKGGLVDGAFKDYNAFVAFCKQLSLHLLVTGTVLLFFKKE